MTASNLTLSDGAQKQFDELKAAMNESGQKFTRLAYKSGESQIRCFLASHDFTLWERLLAGLAELGFCRLAAAKARMLKKQIEAAKAAAEKAAA